MKTKAKLVLALSVLTAGTAVAGATGTFAWFTTNRSATLTYSKVTAVTSNAKLVVSMGSLTESLTEVTNVKADGTYEDAISLSASKSFTTDVSSPDGLNFYQPEWKSIAGNDQPVYHVNDVTGKKMASGGYYTQFYFGVTNTGNADAYVFLNEKTLIKATSDGEKKDKALASWSRVALNDCTAKPVYTVGQSNNYTLTNVSTEAKAKRVIFENEATDGSEKGIAVASTDLKGDNNDLMTTTNLDDDIHQVGAFDKVVAGTATEKYKGFLCKLDAKKDGEDATTHYFVVSVWLEGTESKDQDYAIGGSIDVTLGLTAIETLGA